MYAKTFLQVEVHVVMLKLRHRNRIFSCIITAFINQFSVGALTKYYCNTIQFSEVFLYSCGYGVSSHLLLYYYLVRALRRFFLSFEGGWEILRAPGTFIRVESTKP